MSINKLPIKGIIPATVTPMYSNGKLNFDKIPEQVSYLKKMQAGALFICGTTGESASLTLKERMQLAEAYQKSAEGEIPIIVHVGHNCIRDAQELIKHAAGVEVRAVAFAPPSFFKPEDENAILDLCEELMSQTPDMSYYYYHIPSMTGVHFSMMKFLEQANKRLPGLAGIKYTYEAIDEFLDCQLTFSNRFEMMFGRDELMFLGLAAGADTFVGSTYNYTLPLYKSILTAYENQEFIKARVLQQKAIQMIRILQNHGGGIRFAKMAMKLIGIDCGPVRLPIRPFGNDELNQVRESLNQINFFEWQS